jgi:hypothetical protein
MIPVARKLQERNYNVIIGTGKEHQSLFRNELPGLTYIDFPGFKTGYSSFLPQYIFLLLKIPNLFYHILAEHIRLKRIINDDKIDIVISDNRFGLWSRRIKSVYVTHLPVIPLPGNLKFLEGIGILFHRFFIRKYSFCFIPDLPGDLNLSGRLTHQVKLPENTRFIGILSRFSDRPHSGENKFSFPHNTVILSGPEPQRGILRQKLIQILKHREPPTVILEGKPGSLAETPGSENIISYNHLPADEMQDMITGSTSIVARPGYTSVMELISLNCSALLIPTPGQTEQEYLAKHLSGKGWFTAIPQRKLDTGMTLPSVKASWKSEIIDESRDLLGKALDELLNQ